MPRMSFGKCRKCGSPIAIPGLEASLCSDTCGWVREPLKVEPPPSPKLKNSKLSIWNCLPS
jgi:hypothetical protein